MDSSSIIRSALKLLGNHRPWPYAVFGDSGPVAPATVGWQFFPNALTFGGVEWPRLPGSQQYRATLGWYECHFTVRDGKVQHKDLGPAIAFVEGFTEQKALDALRSRGWTVEEV